MTAIETNPMPGRAVSIRLRAAELVAGAPALARRLDRVVLAFFLLVVFVTAVDPAVGLRTLAYVAAELRGLAPWFALSVLFAAGAKATGSDALIARAFVGREAWVTRSPRSSAD